MSRNWNPCALLVEIHNATATWKSLAISQKVKYRSSHCGSAEMNPTSIHKNAGSILGLAQWVKDLVLP